MQGVGRRAGMVLGVVLMGAAAALAGPAPGSMRSGSVRHDGYVSSTEVVYTVPAGSVFVLTDFCWSSTSSISGLELSINSDESPRWQTKVAPGQPVNLQWITGLVFTAGAKVKIDTQVPTNGTDMISWSGYLVGSSVP